MSDDLTVVDRIAVREQDKGAQLIIPGGLEVKVIHLVHEGHQGPDRTLGLLHQTCWFPDMGAESRSLWRPASCAKMQSPGRGRSQSGRSHIQWGLHMLNDQYSK